MRSDTWWSMESFEEGYRSICIEWVLIYLGEEDLGKLAKSVMGELKGTAKVFDIVDDDEVTLGLAHLN